MATARGYLGRSVSNNVAEYAGLRECLRRAVRVLDPTALFEVDSMLLARQMSRFRPWACRSESLVQIHIECVKLSKFLENNGVNLDIRHIYREYNQTADALSNQAIDEQHSNGQSSGW